MMEAVSVQALCDRQPGNGATAARAHKHSSAGSGRELQKQSALITAARFGAGVNVV